jgi:hypothetical protein
MAIRDFLMASMMSLALGGCSISFMGTPSNSAPGYDWGSKQMSSVDYQDNREKPLRRTPSAKDSDAQPAAKPRAPQRDEPVRKPVRKPAPKRTKPTQPEDTKPDRIPMDRDPVDTKPDRLPMDRDPVDTKPDRLPMDRDPVDDTPARMPTTRPSTKPQREPVGVARPTRMPRPTP